MTWVVHISESVPLHRQPHTSGTPPAGLASRFVEGREQALWQEVEDELHRWLRLREQSFEPDERPDDGVIAAALDFVLDHRGDSPAPVLMAPSGGGRLVMEWREGDTLQTVEFLDDASVEVTEFHRGRVVSNEILGPVPQSRDEAGWPRR